MRLKIITMTLAILMISTTVLSLVGSGQEVVSWQHADFEDNVILDYSPVVPKPTDPIVITVTSKEPDVNIQIAYAELTIEFPSGVITTGGRTFQRINETAMRTSIVPYQYNGTIVKFFINVLDYNNVPMLSPDVELIVLGEERFGGWMHDTFEENIEMVRDPLLPNATEPMTVSVWSKENIPVEGGNLYFLYTPSNGITESGGWPLDRVNLTAMEKEIPANYHMAGTNITFWVIVWDEYSNLTKSGQVNYSIPGIVEFKYPFEYTRPDAGNTTNNSKWYPDNMIMISLLVVSGLAVPTFAYIHVLDKRRTSKKEELAFSPADLKAAGAAKEAGEVPEDMAETAEEIPEPAGGNTDGD